jgi:hypothetical protein
MNFNSLPKRPRKNKLSLEQKITDAALARNKTDMDLFKTVLGKIPHKTSDRYPSVLFNNHKKTASQVKVSLEAFENGRQNINKHKQATKDLSQYKMALFLSNIINYPWLRRLSLSSFL